MNLYRTIALSENPLARTLRQARRGLLGLALPAPRLLTRPLLGLFLAVRGLFHFGMRVFVCEPLFKSYCTRYGRGVHTGVFIHWVQGQGEIVLGDGVLVDGKCSLTFAARFADRPTLEVGSQTIIGHNCKFTIGRRITIGEHCLIASDVCLFDSSGHPTDPSARRAGLPPPAESVRPITIGDNVWIGTGAMILPGVTIGANSVVGAGSIVTRDVPANVLAAGNPARVIKRFTTENTSWGNDHRG